MAHCPSNKFQWILNQNIKDWLEKMHLEMLPAKYRLYFLHQRVNTNEISAYIERCSWHGLPVHFDVIKRKHFSCYRVTGPLCREFTGHPWIPPHKGQWCVALMPSSICAWTNGWVNNRDAGDLRCHSVHDVIATRYAVAWPIVLWHIS